MPNLQAGPWLNSGLSSGQTKSKVPTKMPQISTLKIPGRVPTVKYARDKRKHKQSKFWKNIQLH